MKPAHRNFRLFPLTLAIVSAALLFGGCKTSSPVARHLSESFGQSYRQAFAAQVATPDAPRNRGPQSPLPGEVATKIYRDTYMENMGGGSGSPFDGLFIF